jgi:hypothetical protein
MMESVRTTKTSVNFKVITRRYIPEDSKLRSSPWFETQLELSIPVERFSVGFPNNEKCY